MVTVTITQAAPFHLIADSVDGAPLNIRRTRAGDAWDRAQSDSCAVPAPAGTAGGAGAGSGAGPVSLGLPSLRHHSGATTNPIYDTHDDQR
jgi:tRNA-2-methylthio-N6-dimethylallyladenosine synthase